MQEMSCVRKKKTKIYLFSVPLLPTTETLRRGRQRTYGTFGGIKSASCQDICAKNRYRFSPVANSRQLAGAV
jgi:hypothetical protein